MRVTLGKAVRLPGRRLFRRGEVVEVTESEASLIDSLGARAVVPKKSETRADTVPAALVEPAAPVEDAPVRPAKTATVDAWREYLTAVGINPKGLNKKEMIAAVR